MKLYPKSLKQTFIMIVCVAISAGCMLVSFFASQRYAQSLKKTLVIQGETLGKSMAAQLADYVLINDIASVQKYIDRQKQHYNLEYAFVVQSTSVLAHTFDTGMPEELTLFNMQTDTKDCSMKQLSFQYKGGIYLDVSCPVFEGAGGVMRIGISEQSVREQVMHLWVETAYVTAGVMLLAILAVIALLRNLTRPLEALTDALGQMAQGDEDVQMPLNSTVTDLPGQAEVGTLAKAFNRMLQRLETKTKEVKQSQQQLRMCNDIVGNLASRSTLRDVGAYVYGQCRNIMHCSDLALILGGAQQKYFISVSSVGVNSIDDPEQVRALQHYMERGIEDGEVLAPPLVPSRFTAAASQIIFPIVYNDYCCGVLVTMCAVDCRCDKGEISVLELVLTQTAGSVYRAIANEEERFQLRQSLTVSSNFQGIVGSDPAMQMLFQRMEQVAASDATVLIQSESGTGKELVAHALHALSPRLSQPFVVINCAAYPDTLLESELFGYERGAFTGADRHKIGRFEQAHGGTVFIDEIGEISLSAQVKLLRVLQSRTFERVGGTQSIQVNVRIVAATSRDLQAEIRAGRFREDLYYRLDVVPLDLPPLRERRGDIPLLANHFLSKYSETMHKVPPALTPRALRILMDYAWPGNVRELENVLEQACVLAQSGIIDVSGLPERLQDKGVESLAENRHEFERELIVQALLRTSGNKKEAATQLGMSRTTLYAKMKRYSITL